MNKSEENFPKVLVVALGKINKIDTYNNGLFLRSLFGDDWPKEKIRQIYSSGDNGDEGFFGSYYKIGAKERYFGCLFYKIKNESAVNDINNVADKQAKLSLLNRIKIKVADLFLSTGIYELVFPPKISNELKIWISEYNPDIIVAQGYNLTFGWLPLMIKNITNARLAVVSTDDWPKYLYSGMMGESVVFKWIVRFFVKKMANELYLKSDIPFAFGFPMAKEYKKRYKKNFHVINHSDEPERFDCIKREIKSNGGKYKIVSIGAFNKYRWPLLVDVEKACGILNESGVDVRLVLYSSSVCEDGVRFIENSSYIDILPDPGHHDLPSYLKSADILLLIEGFDRDFVSAIELSISTKAHLYMFSKRPIILYSGEGAGISGYAKEYRWAQLISNRSVEELVLCIKNIINAPDVNLLTQDAYSVALRFHSGAQNRKIFRQALNQ